MPFACEKLNKDGWTMRSASSRNAPWGKDGCPYLDHPYRLVRNGQIVWVTEPYLQSDEVPIAVQAISSKLAEPDKWIVEAKPEASAWNPPYTVAIWIYKNPLWKKNDGSRESYPARKGTTKALPRFKII